MQQNLYLKESPSSILKRLEESSTPFIGFRDASFGPSSYSLQLKDCLTAVSRAHSLRFLDFSNFDAEEYQRLERVENGDLNWIVPAKFLAFCGPVSKSRVDSGYHVHAPEAYLDYFKKKRVKTVIRLNKKMYDSSRFTKHGIRHHDLFFVDGSTPPDDVLNKFLQICESTDDAIAVHCKAGLGRTGSLIGCYLMKHYGFSAPEAMAWIRICRPGSVIGPQQQWLLDKESAMLDNNNQFKKKDEDISRLESLDLNLNLVVVNQDEEQEDQQPTQGDLLNRRKACHQQRVVVIHHPITLLDQPMISTTTTTKPNTTSPRVTSSLRTTTSGMVLRRSS